MIRSLLLSTASVGIVMTVITSVALADTGPRWFAAAPQTCDRDTLAFEMRIDPGASPNLTLFHRAESGSWQGGAFDLPPEVLAGEPIVLTNALPFRSLRLEAAGSDDPRLVVMQYTKDADCAPYALTTVESPSDRYAAADVLVAVDPPTPADLGAARAAVAALPPAGLLPALDQQARPRAVQDGLAALEERTMAAVAITLGRADAPEAAEHLADLRGLWLNRRERAETERLVALQQTRAAALMLAGQDPAGAMVDTDAARLCRAVMERPQNDMTSWPVTLESVAGLPLAFWSRELAEDLIARTTTCGSERFPKIVADNWPAINQRIAAREGLQAEADRLKAVPPTLEAVAAANWLRLESGAVSDDLAPLRTAIAAQLADGAVTPLAEELAGGADDVPLSDLPRHCRLRMAEIDTGFTDRSFQASYRQNLGQRLGVATHSESTLLPDRVVEACEEHLAATLADRGTAQLAEDRVAADSAPATWEGALATHGFGPGPWVAGLYGNGAFAPIIENLQEQAVAFRADMAAKLDPVLATARTDLATAYADLDPADPDTTPIPCPGADAAWAGDVAQDCHMRAAAFRQMQDVAICDARFAAIDAPEGLRHGRLAMFGQIVAVEELLCPLHDEPLDIQKESGFFSSTRHVLTLPMQNDHRFTGTLTPPETGDLWTLTDLDITPGGLKRGLDLNDPATLSLCQSTPTACTR